MRLKKDQKAQAILQAAIKMFAEKGYHQTKITEIADTANVAHGTVYTYFKNKEDLLYNMISKLWQELSLTLEEISNNANLDPLQKVQKMVDAVFDVFTSDSRLGLVVIKEHNQLRKKGMDASVGEYEHLLNSFSHTFEQGVAEGFFDPTIDPDTFLHFVFGGLSQLIHRWANDPRSLNIQKVKEQSKYFVQQSLIKG